jgi:thiol:disulfide interchange protein DsbC
MRPAFIPLALAACCLALPAPAPAQQAVKGSAANEAGASDAGAKETAAIKAQLQAKFPGAEISNVGKSPYFGLYEALFDDRLVYTDAKVTFVMVGAIFDANTKQNFTDVRMRQINRVSWDSLPLDLAFKRVKGDGKRRLAIFSDADCPYCKRIEGEIKKLDDVTIYTFLLPIDRLHPDAARKSALIWCAPDRAKAWDEYFENGRLPDNDGTCATPMRDIARLGERMRVSATPTLVFADGSVLPGAIPMAQLESEINKGEAEAKKLSATK